MTTPQAVIFDMDGTLVDTERVCQAAWRRAAAELGLDVPERIWDAFIGCSIPNAKAIINEEYGDPELTERLFAHQLELFFELRDADLSPCEGALSALDALSGAGLTLALATTTARRHALPLLDRFGMTPYFTAMTFGDELRRLKPAPDIYLETARRLGIAPSACAAVEDSVNGVRAALAADMQTYMVPDCAVPTPDLAQACAGILGSLRELPAALLGTDGR